MSATVSHRRAQCSILYSENYKIVENREIYGYNRQYQSSYIDSLCVMVEAVVTVTILTLVRGNMALYHRHMKVYTCFHLFGQIFGFVSCSGMHSPRDSSLKQITILKIRNLETDLPMMVGKSPAKLTCAS